MDITRPESAQQMPPHAKLAFKGEIFDVYQWEQKLYDGSKAVYEKLKRADTVVVIPVTSEKELVYIEEEQPTIPLMNRFLAGSIEPGETPLEAAKRELLEEIGYASSDWVYLKGLQTIQKLDWAIYVFVARAARYVAPPTPEAGEKITAHTISLDSLLERVLEGTFDSYEMKVEFLKAAYDPEERAQLEARLFGS